MSFYRKSKTIINLTLHFEIIIYVNAHNKGIPSLAILTKASYLSSAVGIYKRKQESKKTRKQELDQESDKKDFLFFFSWSLS